MPPSPFALNLAEIAHEAGKIILRYYAGDITARLKADASPVTAADEAAESFIVERLARLAPGVPVIAEEASQTTGTPDVAPERFFLVDPLDGTKEFLQKNGEFTVNIALIERGRAVCGVVGAPALERLFVGDGANGAFEFASGGKLSLVKEIRARAAPAEGIIALVSRSHSDPETENYLARFRVAQRSNAGSSLKFCLVAAGAGDLYPRFGPTMEWDTAAGQAVLEAAGGSVATPDGKALIYGKAEAGFRNPAFVARGLA